MGLPSTKWKEQTYRNFGGFFKFKAFNQSRRASKLLPSEGRADHKVPHIHIQLLCVDYCQNKCLAGIFFMLESAIMTPPNCIRYASLSVVHIKSKLACKICTVNAKLRNHNTTNVTISGSALPEI